MDVGSFQVPPGSLRAHACENAASDCGYWTWIRDRWNCLSLRLDDPRALGLPRWLSREELGYAVTYYLDTRSSWTLVQEWLVEYEDVVLPIRLFPALMHWGCIMSPDKSRCFQWFVRHGHVRIDEPVSGPLFEVPSFLERSVNERPCGHQDDAFKLIFDLVASLDGWERTLCFIAAPAGGCKCERLRRMQEWWLRLAWPPRALEVPLPSVLADIIRDYLQPYRLADVVYG